MNKIEHPLISVCVTTFNHEHYIEKCIRSILNQSTDYKLNIIIGDDHSTDGTVAILNKLQSENQNVIKLILQEKNKGILNWLECLKICKGKYIALMDGDDFWLDPLKLQKQVKLLETKKNISGCYHPVYIIDSQDSYQIHKNKVFGNTSTSNISIKDILLSKYPLFQTSSFVFRRNFLTIPDWLSKLQSGDVPLFFLLSCKGPIKGIHDVMGVYRIHKNGSSRSKKFQQNKKTLRLKRMEYFNEFTNYKYSDLINRTFNAFKSNLPVQLPLGYRVKKKIRTHLHKFRIPLLSRLLE